MVYTHENHLKYGFIDSDGNVSDQYSSDDIFFVQVGAVRGQVFSPIQEAARAANLIRESTNEKIWLCLSGGVDSESMARGFMTAGIKFYAAIMRFNDDLNWFDIKSAVEFCEAYQIPYQFFDLNIPDFYLSGRHFELAHEFRCNSPQLTTHLDLMDKIPGFPVLSWNLTVPYLRSDGRLSFAVPTDRYFAYERFLKKRARQGAPSFFLHTPELFYSLIKVPVIQEFINNASSRGNKYTIDYLSKCQAYQQGGFDIVPREDKFTGFEKVKLFFEKYFNGEAGAFDRRYREPLTKLYPEPVTTVMALSPTELTKGF